MPEATACSMPSQRSSISEWVTVAPIHRLEPRVSIVRSASMRVISTRRPGRTSRRLSIGPSDWPPAMSLAFSAASAANASSRLRGAT
jgi:hypothetical protein